MRGGLSIVLALLLCYGCDRKEADTPPDFAAILYPDDNASTPEGVDLGERLFFDPLLSADGTVSCASCHQPALAFSDGKPLSVGIDGLVGFRNTPSLTNVGYLHQPLFWDGRATNLEAQALHPVGTAHEMAGSWPVVIDALRSRPTYVTAFREAFGDVPIDSTLVGRALAQYQRTLVSMNSTYDRVRQGEAQYTEQEALGHAIFFDLGDDPGGPFAGLVRGECAHCHTPPHFTNQRYANNGLDEAVDLDDFTDKGRGAINGQRYDNGRFRTPGLRNVALTAPYMHDGRFGSLQEVVAHYNSGGEYAENKSANVRPLGLSVPQQAALVAFLETLTDDSFVVGSLRGVGLNTDSTDYSTD
ncbi:Cytochrome c551 peroxidase [Neolewinella maritima]|uniref:Cytochrome c551 peroxidase n=1 Tax=Neolewinella maritima TaxID=1383882 RepID=A0ABN8F5G9_9BACT|nr:cytochrome c peroxidase [Neolewinella maritima]CAH1000570.1 Cytochrome c551 peroxidase [Neolewinella maritima]